MKQAKRSLRTYEKSYNLHLSHNCLPLQGLTSLERVANISLNFWMKLSTLVREKKKKNKIMVMVSVCTLILEKNYVNIYVKIYVLF